jgi:hypothetical protein
LSPVFKNMERIDDTKMSKALRGRPDFGGLKEHGN